MKLLAILALLVVTVPVAAHADWYPGWDNGPGWGYPPPPPPPYPDYPPPPPPQNNGYSMCIVSNQYGSFQGYGYDVGEALANARNACIYQVNNARICMSAPYTCRQ
jgi:hypothetical protein